MKKKKGKGKERWKNLKQKFLQEKLKMYIRGCIQKFQDWVDNKIYADNNKHSLGSDTKGYEGKTT
jgi:hypothetical protein